MSQPKSPLGPLWTLVQLVGGTVVGWITYSRFFVDHDRPISAAIDAPRHECYGANSTFLSYYADTSASGRPLVLLHSINAAGSAYEMGPLFDAYRAERPVYALDLPGFGFSAREQRDYTPELYMNAILDFMRQVVGEQADVISLSLSGEFLGFAAQAEPEHFNTLVMISPTGFALRENRTRSQQASYDEDRTSRAYRVLSNPLWGQALFDLLGTKPVIRYFYKMSFAGEVPEEMVEYAHLTTHQPGAHHAPLAFVSGKLFTSDIKERVYQTLKLPVLVTYNDDEFVRFDTLPQMVEQYPNWRARRIPNTKGLPHFEKLPVLKEHINAFWSEA